MDRGAWWGNKESDTSEQLALSLCNVFHLILNLISYKCAVLSCVRLFATPCQAPLSMEFSRQEHWSGLPFPCPEALPDPGTEPRSPAIQANALPSELLEKP